MLHPSLLSQLQGAGARLGPASSCRAPVLFSTHVVSSPVHRRLFSGFDGPSHDAATGDATASAVASPDSTSSKPRLLFSKIPTGRRPEKPPSRLGFRTVKSLGRPKMSGGSIKPDPKPVQRRAFETLEYLMGKTQLLPRSPNLWLRDACRCEKCVDPHSGQKNFATTQLDLNPRVRSMQRGDDGTMTVVWANDPISGGKDHTSVYPATVDHDRHKFMRRDLWNRDLFEQGREKCRVSYDEWMAGGSEFWAAMASLARIGLIFVHGIPEGDEAAVDRIGEQIGPLQETFYGRTWDVVSKPQAENVAYTSQFLGLHQDLLYYPDPPRIQLLHCLANDCEGGESLFSDGVYAATTIKARPTRAQTFDVLSRSPTAYHYNKNGNVYYAERPVVLSDFPGANSRNRLVENVWWSPPFQALFPVERSSTTAWFLAAKQFQLELERPENVVRYRMRPGECVVFDNRRVLHGRRQFDASSGKRWLKGAYVDDRTYRARFEGMPADLATQHGVWRSRGEERRQNLRAVNMVTESSGGVEPTLTYKVDALADAANELIYAQETGTGDTKQLEMLLGKLNTPMSPEEKQQ